MINKNKNIFDVITDPMERILVKSFIENNIKYVSGQIDPDTTKNLDFYLPEYDIYVEVKQFHTERIIKQMSRVDNIIVIQGRKAVENFSKIISKK